MDGSAIAGFISNLVPQESLQLLRGGLPLSFDNLKNILTTRLVPSVVKRICKALTEILHELEAPW